MKTTNTFFAALLLPLLFSCTKEEAKIDTDITGKYDFTITACEDENSITKASLSDDEGICWTPGGKAGIVDAEGNKTESSPLTAEKIYTYPEDVQDQNAKKYNQASFVFNDTNTGEYKFFYPYHADANNSLIPFWVDPSQTTSAGKSADCFALVSNGLVTLDPTKHDTGAHTTYKVVGSYIRFIPFGKEGETVRYIITKGQDRTVSGRYFVTWDNEFDHTDLQAETITLTLSDEYKTKASVEESSGMYTPVLPGKSKNTYTVVTDKGYYVFESSSEKDFAFGQIKNIPLNLASEKAGRTPEKLYIVGDATTIGWHAGDAIELKKVEGKNQFVAENIQLIPAAEGFKFNTKKSTSDDAWNNAFVNSGDNETLAYYVNIPSGKDKKFTVDKAGKYNLTVDFDTFKITKELVEEYPFVSHWNYEKQAIMYPTDTEGEYKASGVIIGGDAQGYHDFKIIKGDSFYKPASYTEISSFESSNNYVFSCSVSVDTKGDTPYKDLTGWWINAANTQNERYYDMTLNTKANTLEVRFSQGKTFWLNGDSFVWGSKKDEYKSTDSDGDGIVTWDVTINQNAYKFRICGEYTYPFENQFFQGEWYYSNEDGVNLKDGTEVEVLPFVSDLNNSNWQIGEAGNYKIIFNYKTLKIKVEKNQQ